MTVSAEFFARMHYWLTLSEAARLLGITRQSTHEAAERERWRVERSGPRRTDPLRIAACCVEGAAWGFRCPCRRYFAPTPDRSGARAERSTGYQAGNSPGRGMMSARLRNRTEAAA